MPKVFISYSSVDRGDALFLRQLLTQNECTVWLDVFDIQISEDLRTELGDGVAAADVFCLLLSPTAVASPWVEEEIRRAEELRPRGLRMIPILLRPCRPPDTLVGKVMLDASNGVQSPDVQARIRRAVLGAAVVGDEVIDLALQEALAGRQAELEAAQILPSLAEELDTIADRPIHDVELSFNHRALRPGDVLAIGLTVDQLFSEPMFFLFAHYREGHTWPTEMGIDELPYTEIPDDGKRVDGRFQWSGETWTLTAHGDGTDLRDLPATFSLSLAGTSGSPPRGTSGIAYLPQKLEIPALSQLISKNSRFELSLLDRASMEPDSVPEDENDFDVRVTALFDNDRRVTLYRSSHTAQERAILNGSFLATKSSAIEREAVLGFYRHLQIAAAERREQERRRVYALLDKPEEALSPDERLPLATLRFGRAKLAMFRVNCNAPPPGPARIKLHDEALEECRAVCRLLRPLISEAPNFDTVGMSFWAANNLSEYYRRCGHVGLALDYAKLAREIVADAEAKDEDEPAFQRWDASARARLRELCVLVVRGAS